MIDLHSHLIPNVDDGAATIEESMKMLQQAAADGVKTMVATPHMYSVVSQIKSEEELAALFQDFKQKVDQSGIEIEVVSGSENYFISGLKEKLKNYAPIITINNSDYFLLEFPYDFIFPGSKDFIFEILNQGFIPIICHPERNTVIQENPGILYDFLIAGAISQLDAGSIRGEFGSIVRETSFKLLSFNLVHLIASDSHDSFTRPPGLSFAYQVLKGMDKQRIDMYVDKIPKAIINNEAIPDLGPLQYPQQKKSFFGLLKERDKP